MSNQPRFKRKAFKFPLYSVWGKVYTQNDNMAFDFIGEYRDMLYIQADIVNTINGKKEVSYPDMSLTYKDGKIYDNGEEFISIRGWGYLTSPNCLGYEPHKAAKIQDEFADYIINKLTPKN